MTHEDNSESQSNSPSPRKFENIFPKTLHFLRVVPKNAKYAITPKDLEYVRSIVSKHIADRPEMKSEDMALRVKNLELSLPSRRRVSLVHTPITLYGPSVFLTKAKGFAARDMEVVRKSIVAFVHSKTEGIFILNGAISIQQQGAN
jgi:hypothetical protein